MSKRRWGAPSFAHLTHAKGGSFFCLFLPFEQISTTHSNWRMDEYYILDNNNFPAYTVLCFGAGQPVSLAPKTS